MTKKDQIIEEIRKIYDPELPVNIVIEKLILHQQQTQMEFRNVRIVINNNDRYEN